MNSFFIVVNKVAYTAVQQLCRLNAFQKYCYILAIQMNYQNTQRKLIPMSNTQTVINTVNSFCLNRISPQCYYRSVTVDFTPPVSLGSSSISIVPTFLRDKNFFTPAFVIPRDKEYYQSTSDFEKHRFEERILKVTQQNEALNKFHKNSELLPAVPTSQFCQICKHTFTSYSQHIRDPLHIQKIKKNKVNSYIAQLSNSVNKRFKQSMKKQKTKKIEKNTEKKGGKKRGRKSTKNTVKQEQAQAPQTTKSFNNSTNALSIVPTPY